MSWPLVFFTHYLSPWRYEDAAGKVYTYEELPTGACWFCTEPWRSPLSSKYHQQHAAKRLPLTVLLPGGNPWCVDTIASTGGEGWDVTGDVPKITVNPSINFIGRYHGWIRDGVITEDCEGRKFP